MGIFKGLRSRKLDVALDDDLSCKDSILCTLVISVIGMFLLIVRVVSFGLSSEVKIQFTSSFIVLMTSIALLAQLRFPVLNAVAMTSFPLTILISIGDIYQTFATAPSALEALFLLTLHIPVATTGIFVFARRRELTNFYSVAIAAGMIVSWLVFVDPRVVMGEISLDLDPNNLILIVWSLFYTVPLAFILYDLYRIDLMFGAVADPVCKCAI